MRRQQQRHRKRPKQSHDNTVQLRRRICTAGAARCCFRVNSDSAVRLTYRQHRSRYQETGAVCLFFRFGAGGLPFQPNGKAAVPRLQDHRGECCLKAALRDSDRIGEPFMAEIQSVPADGNRIVSAPEFQRQFRRVLRGEALLTEGQSPGGSVGRGNRYGQRAGSFVLCKRDAVDRSGKAPRTILLRRDAAAAVQY